MVPEVTAGAQKPLAAIATGFKLILEKQSMFVVLQLRVIEMVMNGLQYLIKRSFSTDGKTWKTYRDKRNVEVV